MAHCTNTRIRSMVAAAATMAFCPAVLSGLAHAAPQQQSKPTSTQNTASTAASTTDSVTVARYLFESVKVRFTAGVATQEELEQAKAAIAIAEAEAQLVEARAAHERQNRMVVAGVASVETLDESVRVVFEKEVALYQAHVDAQQQAVNRVQAQAVTGTVSRTQVDAALMRLDMVKARLTGAKLQYKVQRLTVLKARVGKQQAMLRSGVASQADVDKAQAEYDAVVAAGLDLK